MAVVVVLMVAVVWFPHVLYCTLPRYYVPGHPPPPGDDERGEVPGEFLGRFME